MHIRLAATFLSLLTVVMADEEDPPPRGGAIPAVAGARPASTPPSAIAAIATALPYVAEGEHYRTRSDVSAQVAAESLAVLEVAWPLFVERFGGEARPRDPDGRLTMHIYRSRDSYRARPGPRMEPWTAQAAGFYDRIHGVGHLEWSPLAYSQRRLLLHEAAHQFHYLSLGAGRRDIFPRWYVEGVANDLDRHRYEDGVLELMVEDVPFTLGHEDLALRHIRSPRFQLDRLVQGRVLSGIEDDRDKKSIGHVFVRFIRSHESPDVRSWFTRFERAVSAGDEPPSWSAKELPSLEDLHRQLVRFARALVPSRTTPQSEWLRDEDEVHACVLTGGSSCWPVLPPTAAGAASGLRFEVGQSLHPSDGIGFVLGFVDAANFTVVVFKDRLRRVLVTTRRSGRWTFERVSVLREPAQTQGVAVELALDGEGAFGVRLDGELMVSGRLPKAQQGGATGFWGEAADAPGQNPGTRLFRFRRVEMIGN